MVRRVSPHRSDVTMTISVVSLDTGEFKLHTYTYKYTYIYIRRFKYLRDVNTQSPRNVIFLSRSAIKVIYI